MELSESRNEDGHFRNIAEQEQMNIFVGLSKW